MNNKKLCLIISLLTIASLSGCNSNNNDSENTNNEAINIFTINGNYAEGVKKDSVWKYIEEKADVSFSISGAINNGDYYTTLSPKINTAKNMPDAFFSVPQGTDSSYYKWADQTTGVLYNLDELLAGNEDKYPYLYATINSPQFVNMRFDGAHTLIPNPSLRSGWGIYYRSDWLINVGYYQKDESGKAVLDENGNKIARTPVTMDEFSEVLKLFTIADPDQNGKNDTYGISPGSGAHMTNPLYHAFGVPTDWDVNDENNIEYMYLSPEYKNYLSWFQKQYNNGYIEPQFYMNKNDSDRKLFENGKVGIIITNAEAHVMYVAKPMEDIFGKNKTVMGVAPIGTKTCGKEGAQGFSDWGGTWGGFSITKTCKNIDGTLRLFDYLLSPEGALTASYGIKDVHYEMKEDNKPYAILENRYKETEDSFTYFKDENGSSEPLGTYRFYSYLLSSPHIYDLKTNTYTMCVNYQMFDGYYYKLMEDANNLMVTHKTKLENFTDFTSSVLKKRSQIENEAASYAVQAMACKKNLTSDYDEMVKNCQNYGLDTVKKIMKAKAIECKIIEE